MLKIRRRFHVLFLGALAIAGCDKGPTKAASGAPITASAKAVDPATEAAHPPTSAEGKTFGAGVTVAEATPIAAILAAPGTFKGKTVRVEGMITDVCERRGCWFEMAGDGPGLKLRFKVADGEMTFPLEAKGKYAVAQGEIAVNELTLEQTRAQAAEDAQEKGQQLDPATVTTPTVSVRLDGTGAVVREKK